MSLSENEIYEFENFRLDVDERIFTRNGTVIQVPEKAFDTIAAFLRRPNRLASKDELMSEIWPDAFVEENNLDKNISLLRRVFEENGGRRDIIETIRGRGYRLTAEVSKIDPKEAKVSAGRNADRNPAPRKKSKKALFAAAAAIVAIAVLAGVRAYWTTSAEHAEAPIRRIAVLPFKPLVTANRNEYIELGMTDALIDKLNEAKDIIVSPLSSVRQFAPLEQDPVAAGRQLGVEAIIDGSVQSDGDRLRISVRLLRVSDGRQLWSQQFDDQFTDIFTVQDSISERVAAVLKLKLGSEATRRYTENAEAYRLYLLGRHHSQMASAENLKLAAGYLDQALQIDPNYAPAYVALADTHRASVLIGDEPPSVAMPKAMAAALRAIEIDDDLAGAHAILGSLKFWYEWDWDGAEREFKRALDLDPRSTDTYQSYAHLLSNTGRHEEALAKIERGIEVEPLSPRANALKGIFLLNARRPSEAAAQLKRTLELEPEFRLAQMFLARALTDLGNYEEALSVIRRTRLRTGDAAEPMGLEGCILARSGRTDDARGIRDRLLEESKTRYISNVIVGRLFAELGDRDAALERLRSSLSNRDLLLVFLPVDAAWDPVRTDPRFEEVLNRMNLHN